MNDKSRENELIDIQAFFSIAYIISLSITTYLIYKRKQRNNTNNHGPDQNDNLRVFNRIFLIIIYLGFLYVSYTSYNDTRSRADRIAYYASIVAVIPPIMQLYAYFINKEEQNSENPIL